jgi:hypothetical protein
VLARRLDVTTSSLALSLPLHRGSRKSFGRMQFVDHATARADAAPFLYNREATE